MRHFVDDADARVGIGPSVGRTAGGPGTVNPAACNRNDAARRAARDGFCGRHADCRTSYAGCRSCGAV